MFERIARPLLVLLGPLLLPLTLSSQSRGWELLRDDDHLAARTAFEQDLEKDSLDLSALKGMILLSDIHGDGLHLREYLTRYVEQTWDPDFYRLFEYSVALSDTVIAGSPMPIDARVVARANLAGEHAFYRDPEKGKGAWRELIPANEWRMIGPFENIGGSGFVTAYPVESARFDPDASFPNRLGVPISWIRPSHVETSGEVNFDHHLPDGDVKVAYANTFIEMPEDRLVELRVARRSPIKMWIDDDLVFSDAEPVAMLYDDEIVRVRLSTGSHRVLVKLAPYRSGRDSYGLLGTNIPRSPEISGRNATAGRWAEGAFAIRITDESGEAMQDVALRLDAEYTPTDHRPIVEQSRLLAAWQRRLAEDPQDPFTLAMLAKAYLISGRAVKGETAFVERMKGIISASASTGSTPSSGIEGSIIMRWLLARLYAANGKVERMYGILEPADPEKTPIYGLLDEKIDEVDPDVREEEFLERYEQLRAIAPSNFSMVRRLISYYDLKDKKAEKDAFIDRVAERFPEYEDYIESDRSDYKYRGDIDERSPAEQADSLLGVIEETVDLDAYDELIDYFTDKKEIDRVIDLHQQRIEAWPSYVYYRRQLAEYQREEKMYDAAIETLESAIGIIPYSVSLREDIGDIYLQMERPEDALAQYREGRDIDLFGYSFRSGYRDNSVVEKIENIVGAEKVDEIFRGGLDFEDAMSSTGWMARYADEESVIPLYEKRQVIGHDGRVRTWSKLMVRILTEAGADWWTEYNFSALGRLTSARVRKAGGGEVVPDRRGPMVVFKGLEPGDVILIEGESEETLYDGLFDGEYFDLTFLSFGAPMHHARVEILTPPDRPINYLHHRIDDNLARERFGDYDSWVWEYTDLDRMPEEDAMVDGMDGLRSIFISTMHDWSRVVDWYLKKTYRRTEPSYDVAAIADSVAGTGTDEQKIAAVYDYVTREVNYSHVNFLNSAYTPKEADLTLSSNVGDCKDVATLMIAMLDHVGVEAWYTLVKTKAFSHQRFLPSQLFDHVIVGVEMEGERRYMDLTTNFYPHTVVPFNDCGAWSLDVRAGEDEVFELPLDHVDPAKNLVAFDVTARLDTSRAVALDVAATHDGLEGSWIRESIGRMSKEEFRNMLLDVLGKGTFQDLRLVDYEIDNRMAMNEPLSSRYRLTGNRFSDRVSNLYIFRLPWMLAIRNNNAIKTAERMTALNVASLCETAPSRQTASIIFPDGYELTELPDDIVITSKFGSYAVRYREIDGGLAATKEQSFTSTVIEPEDFEDFREFYLRILDVDEARYAIIRK